MAFPSMFLRLVVTALFGVLGSGASTLLAQEEQLIQPTSIHDLNDSHGNIWNLGHMGTVNDPGGRHIESGAALVLNGGGIASASVKMTPDGSEYVFLGRQGSVNVTRRIRFDSPHGVVRYIDAFQNGKDVPQQLQITFTTRLGSEASQVLDTKNKHFTGRFENDEGVFLAVPRFGQSGVVLLVSGPKGRAKPQVRIQGGRLIEVMYRLELPPRGSVAIYHCLALRRSPSAADTASFYRAFFRGGRLADRDIPPKYKDLLVNFSTKPETDAPADTAEAPAAFLAEFDQRVEISGLNRDQQDAVMIDADAKLAGSVTGSDFTLETVFGTTKIPFAEVAGISGGAGVQRPIRVFLRNGEILSGRVNGAKMSVATDAGLNLDLDLTQIELLALKRTDADGKAAAGAGSLVTTHGGECFAIAPDSAAVLDAATPWGTVTVPFAEVESLTYGHDPFPSYRLTLADSSRLLVMLRGSEWALNSLRFGGIKVIPQSVREVRRIGEYPNTAAGKGASSDPITFTLIGENRLAGVLDLPALQFASETNMLPLDPKKIVQLGAEKGDNAANGVLVLKLSDGKALRGRLVETVLPIRSGNRVWRVPVAHLVSMSAPSREESGSEQKPAGQNQPNLPGANSSPVAPTFLELN